MLTIRRTALLLLLPATLAACGEDKAPPPMETETPAPAMAVSVTGLDLGRGADASGAITMPAEVFGTRDTIYVGVRTAGSGDATLAATWTYEDGQVVHEDSRAITATGPATTSFFIAKDSAWPTGTYSVSVTLDGAPAGSKQFTVR